MLEEIDTVLGGRQPEADDVEKLTYTRMVFAEAMRLYPPVWGSARRPDQEDLDLGDYVVPRNSTVFLSQYVIHHDERFFPDPERFDPERFTPEEEAKRSKFAYFPFSAGHRKCIGEGMAWQEGVLVMAAIAPRWQLRMVPDHPVELAVLTVLRPKHGLRMVLEKRSRQTSDHVRTSSAAASSN